MLIGNVKDRGVGDFLAKATVRVAVSPPVRCDAFHFKVDCRSDRLFALLSMFPGTICSSTPGTHCVKIKSSDIVRFRAAIRNPIRASASGDEYHTRLVTYLLLESTSLFQKYGENLYSYIHNNYIHDMRAGGGKFQQCINYIKGTYPGRLPDAAFTGSNIRLCFPNPALLQKHFRFLDDGWCYVLSMRDTEAGEQSLLLEAVSMRLQVLDRDESRPNREFAAECLRKFLESATGGTGAGEQGSVREIRIPCEDFFVIIREVISDSSVKSRIESQLHARQGARITHGLKKRFGRVRRYCGRLRNANTGISNGAAGIRKAVISLRKAQLLVKNQVFFERLNPLGVLQAQQYFRGMNAIIESMISCLKENERVWTEEELTFFLRETHGSIVRDIDCLLSIHDFFVIGRTVHRDAIIKFTFGEVSEISTHIGQWISLFNRIHRGLVNGEYGSLDEVTGHTSVTNNAFCCGDVHNIESLLGLNTLSQLFERLSDGSWRANVQVRNKLLFRHVKSHRLCDFLCDFEYKSDHRECDELLGEMFSSGCTRDRTLLLLRKIVQNYGHEWIRDVDYSIGLSVAQSAYKVSRWVPFHSLWLPWVNPARYRTSSGYRGRGIKGRLCAKNMMIPLTEFSRVIRSGLRLTDMESRFVEGDYEAEMLGASFRIEHNIPGFLERATFFLRKNKWVWYPVLGFFMVLCSAVAVIGRVLDYFGIIPGVVVKGALDIFRSIFDSVVVVVGLDTAVEKMISLIVSIAGIIVRTLDFILFYGLLSKVTRFIFRKFHDVCDYLFNALISACEHVRLYGFKNACLLLLEKLLCTDGGECPSTPDLLVTDDQELGEEAHCNSTGTAATQDVCIQTLVEKLYAECQSLPNALGSLSRDIAEELYGCKPDVRSLLCEFRGTLSLPQCTVFEENYSRLRGEFFFLINNYHEGLSVGTGNSSRNANIFNSYAARREVYDRVTAVNLQTLQLTACGASSSGDSRTVRNIIDHEDVKVIINAARSHGQSITLSEVGERIAALRWALSMFDLYDSTGIVMRHEAVISGTGIERSCALSLMDCVLTLQSWRETLLGGGRVSRDFALCDLRSNFSPYLRDTCCILDAMDRSVSGRRDTVSYRRFLNIMCPDFLLLETPSLMARNVSNFVGLSLGARSYLAELKDGLVSFANGFRELKLMLASLAVYQVTALSGAEEFQRFFDHYSKFSNYATQPIGVIDVYDFFISTHYSEQFLSFFWRSIFLRDVIALLGEFFQSITPFPDIAEVPTMFSAMDHRIYRSSFFYGDRALREVKSSINAVGDLICTIFQVHQIRAILRSARSVGRIHGNMEYFVQLEEAYTARRDSRQVQFAWCGGSASSSSCVDSVVRCNEITNVSCCEIGGEYEPLGQNFLVR
ncbi:hypothetical protein OC188_02350 [Anaplasma capra]|uniref:hypothetical protein n=1 Tax=Anaplasma capra TaxID=1562740 RepID=UPI0021D5FB01|nr:hypothetical protein [Anaplasma capra]MCU7611536.1 hypothetical protein [Anaplasma capra]